jgi:peptidoglycan/LPS O-acetylase OafA/YrhL
MYEDNDIFSSEYPLTVAQAVVAMVPNIRGHGWWLLLAAAPLTFAFAVASWHFVEKPTLALKKILVDVARRSQQC